MIKGVPITPQVGRYTLGEAVTDLLAFRRMKGLRSVDETERRLRLHVVPYFGAARKMASITATHVLHYTVKRQADTIITQHARTVHTRKGTREIPGVRKPVSNGEINRELSALRRCFTVAIKHGVLLHRPSFDLLPESAPRSGFVDAGQIASVCRHLTPVLAAVVRFA